jgi:hypothetical protein
LQGGRPVYGYIEVYESESSGAKHCRLIDE